MIASLTGTVQHVGVDHAVIDVRGVGYLVQAAVHTLSWLRNPPIISVAPPEGVVVTVQIETVVREDSITLYGFRFAAERAAFRRLQTIQGVGSRVSLAILSTLPVPDLARAIALGDGAMLARTPGVGPKLATRIVTELKDKLADFSSEPQLLATAAAPVPAADSVEADAVSALVNLGYRPAEAARAVAQACRDAGEGLAMPVLIREALKRAAR